MRFAGQPPDDDADPNVVEMYAALADMREFRSDISDGVWNSGLKTVRDSVRRHSKLAPGEKAYIRFVEPYLK